MPEKTSQMSQMHLQYIHLGKILQKLEEHGIRVIRFEWAEFYGIQITVSKRSELDKIKDLFGLRLGEPYGSVSDPRMPLHGIVEDEHIQVCGPLRRE